jgi:spore coat polysaccharide biosynthesis protein SpsF
MNIGALVPVRLASERLPGKALLPLAGKPVITHLLERLFSSRYLHPERVIVCTTTEPSDDPLVPVVEAMGAHVFRGSRDDIIDRFYCAAHTFGLDAFIQADGDDPCTDPTYMDHCMDKLLVDESLDIVLSEGLPVGLNPRAIRTAALNRVWQHHRTEQNDTGFTYYFTRTGLCTVAAVRPETPDHQHATARLTLDYPEDLACFRAIFARLYTPGQVFGVAEIVRLLHQHPELVAMNADLRERYEQRTRERAHLEYELDGKLYRVEA